MNIDDRLEALTMNLELLYHSHEAVAKLQAKTEAGLAKTEAGLAKTEAGLAKTEAGLAKTDNLLRRAIAASVKEALQERRKRRESEAQTQAEVKELRNLQKVTQRMFQVWLERSSNGKH